MVGFGICRLHLGKVLQFFDIPLSLGVPLGMNSNQDETYFLQLIFIPRETHRNPQFLSFKESRGFPNRRELIFI